MQARIVSEKKTHNPQHFVTRGTNSRQQFYHKYCYTLKYINWEMSALRIGRPSKTSNWEMPGPANQRTENWPTLQISLTEKCLDWELSGYPSPHPTKWSRHNNFGLDLSSNTFVVVKMRWRLEMVRWNLNVGHFESYIKGTTVKFYVLTRTCTCIIIVCIVSWVRVALHSIL